MTICFHGSHSFCLLWHVTCKEHARKDLCMNGVEDGQCDKVCQQCDGWLAETAGYDIIRFACGGAVHLLLQGYFIVHKCLHYISKLSTSSVLCMCVILPQAECIQCTYVQMLVLFTLP